MKKQSFLIVLSLFIYGICCSQSKNKSVQQQILPKGAFISNHKIALKKGYSFQKVSANEVNVVTTSTALINGTFQCGCHTDTGGGECTVQTFGNTISCIAVSCNDCGMRTTIDPPKPDPLKGGGKGTKEPHRKWIPVNIN